MDEIRLHDISQPGRNEHEQTLIDAVRATEKKLKVVEKGTPADGQAFVEHFDALEALSAYRLSLESGSNDRHPGDMPAPNDLLDLMQ